MQPSEIGWIIEKLQTCSDEDLLDALKCFQSWNYGKCELYHWCGVLDRFDSILEKATAKHDPEEKNPDTWVLEVDTKKDAQVGFSFIIIKA